MRHQTLILPAAAVLWLIARSDTRKSIEWLLNLAKELNDGTPTAERADMAAISDECFEFMMASNASLAEHLHISRAE